MLHLLIQVPTQAIESKLNSSLGEILYEEGSTASPSSGRQVRVRRRTPLQVSTRNNQLLIYAPVHVWTHQGKRDDLMDLWKEIPMVDVEEIDFELTAEFRISLQVDSNWNLHATVDSGFTWDRKPRVGIALMKFNVTGIVKPILEAELAKVADQISHFIERELDFHGYVESAWQIMQERHLAEESLPISWWLNPSSATVIRSPMVCHKDEIQIQIGLQVFPQALLGKMPDSRDHEALPATDLQAELPLESDLQLLVRLPYRAMEDLYRGTSFSFRKGSTAMRITNLLFETQEKFIHLRIELEGESSLWRLRRSHSGVLTISGVPIVDESGNVILTEFACHWEQLDWLSRLVVRLKAKSLQATIKAYLHQVLQDSISQGHAAILESLTRNQLTEQVLLDAKMEVLEPTKIEPDVESVNLKVTGKGKLGITLSNF